MFCLEEAYLGLPVLQRKYELVAREGRRKEDGGHSRGVLIEGKHVKVVACP